MGLLVADVLVERVCCPMLFSDLRPSRLNL